MKTIKFGIVLVCVMTVIGCFSQEQKVNEKSDINLPAVAIAKAGPAPSHAPSEVEGKVEETIVQGNNKFAIELYAKLQGAKGNLFFSPYSISSALAMTYAGAKGQTQSQMAAVLHFPIRTRFHSAFGKIIKDLNARGKNGRYELTIANALWGQKGFEFLKEFLRLIKANYNGQLNEVDFVSATEAARKTINAWVEQKTKDKIKELIKPGVLDAMTRLVLTNAIYFKGNWASQFKEEQTKNAPFILLNGNKPVSSAVERIEVPMMNQTGQFPYAETESFQALELPYVDNELSMIIFLPKEIDGLKEFEQEFTTNNVSRWLSKLHKREVIVFMPKLKMTSEFSLASVLKSMGMTDAFSPSAADFSGMTGKKDLCISAVIHKAYVDINEEGTEAAAATAVTMRLTSVGPSQTPVFRADHPFVFLIRDNQTSSILFIGRVMNPKQ
jgi:serpin B